MQGKLFAEHFRRRDSILPDARHASLLLDRLKTLVVEPWPCLSDAIPL
jgi:hypothetical protein